MTKIEAVETNEERLENMSVIGVDGKGNVLIKGEDWHWLTEQTGRAQELEELVESHAPDGRNYTNAQHVQLLQEYKDLKERVRIYEMKYENTGSIFNRSNQIKRIEEAEKENKRLREALELIKTPIDYVSYEEIKLMKDIARHALEDIE